jgi:hypothetical protein
LLFASFRARTHDANYPDWFFGVVKENAETYLFAATSSQSSAGFQDYEWLKEVPSNDVTIENDLLSFAIDTGADLGSYGAIDMAFSPTHSARHRFVCQKTGKLLGTVRRAQGNLSGTLSFTPGSIGLTSSVRVTHPHVRIDRIAVTGERCPGQEEVPHEHYCPTGASFEVRDSDGASLYVEPRFGFIEASTATVVDGWTLYRSMASFPNFDPWGSSGDNPVTITGTTLRIDGDVAGDLLGGTVVFARSGPSVTRSGARCQRTTAPFVWREGTLEVRFDSGSYGFTGAGLDARMFRVRRAR